MKSNFLLSWALSLASSHTLAFTPCPLLGPGYPQPVDLTSNSSVLPNALADLAARIDSYLANNQTSKVNVRGHSFSIGAFSIHDRKAQHALQYHHSGTPIGNLTNSTSHVDGSSVYRVASLSKLFTVYLTLIELGSDYWHRPITDFVPELEAANRGNKSAANPIAAVSWKDVSLGALAGQISGAPRDVSFDFTDLAVRLKQAGSDPTKEGLPFVNATTSQNFPACNFFAGEPCNTTEFFKTYLDFAPTFLPWTTPTYADPTFTLLSVAVERITGHRFSDLLQTSLFSPLNLSSTSYNVARNASAGVIPGGDPSAVLFDADVGPEGPVFGIFSSLDDLSKLGVAILNSTLLSPGETRQWLKPISHTSNSNYSVGRPWEIYRVSQPVTGRLNDLYTKDGNLGNYTSLIALSPDHGAGFAVLVAGPQAQAVLPALEDMVIGTVFPAFEAQAAAEAKRNYGGAYGSGALNSSVAFDVDPSSGPGLVLTSWISNGTDLIPLVASTYGITDLDARLYPTDLVEEVRGGGRRVSFRAVFGDKSPAAAAAKGPFSGITACSSWGSVDAIYYAGKAFDQFVFELDASGKATSVVPAAVRARLRRT